MISFGVRAGARMANHELKKKRETRIPTLSAHREIAAIVSRWSRRIRFQRDPRTAPHRAETLEPTNFVRRRRRSPPAFAPL